MFAEQIMSLLKNGRVKFHQCYVDWEIFGNACEKF